MTVVARRHPHPGRLRALLFLSCATACYGGSPVHDVAIVCQAACSEEHRPLCRRARPCTRLVAAVSRPVSQKEDRAINARASSRRFRVSTRAISALLKRYRLTAFVSEVGESLRPVPGVLTWHVNLFYLVSWAYVIADTAVQTVEEAAVEGRQRQVARVLLFMSLFHGLATMLIPAVAIHEAVRATKALLARLAAWSGSRSQLMAGVAAAAVAGRLWLPTLVGLSLIPAMPIVDKPLHGALKLLLDQVWPAARADATDSYGEAYAAHPNPNPI